jgi:hypothetical protein
LKQRKENDIPMAMLQNQEPAKKRSKLVLPEPQISDKVNIYFALLIVESVYIDFEIRGNTFV